MVGAEELTVYGWNTKVSAPLKSRCSVVKYALCIAIAKADVSRDIFLYASSVDSRGLEETVDILGEVVLRPLFTQEEMDISEQMIRQVLGFLKLYFIARRQGWQLNVL